VKRLEQVNLESCRAFRCGEKWLRPVRARIIFLTVPEAASAYGVLATGYFLYAPLAQKLRVFN
jgi:hypothetical protein